MVRKLLFRPSFKLFRSFVADHSLVYLIFCEILGLSITLILVFYRCSTCIVTCNHSTMPFQLCRLKNLPVTTRLINTVGHKHGISIAACQSPFGTHILANIRDNTVDTLLTAKQLLHFCPTLFQSCPGDRTQTPSLRVKPLIDFLSFAQVLFYISGLITQVKNNPIFYGLIKLIAMYIRTKGLYRFFLIRMEQRRTRETYQHHIVTHYMLHGFVKHASLCAMTFINKDINITLRSKISGERFCQLFKIQVERLTCLLISYRYGIAVILIAKFVNQRANQPRFGSIEHLNQLTTTLGSLNLLPCIFEARFYLFVQLITVCNNHHTSITYVFSYPSGQPNHRKRFTRTLRMPYNTVLLLANSGLSCLDGKILIRTCRLFYTSIEDDKIMDIFQ